MPITADKRGYITGSYAIELDGTFAGWLSSAEGGAASADVVAENIGPDGVVRKHIANVKWEDIRVACGTSMSKAFYDWISNMLNLKPSRKNGAIVTLDYGGKSLSRLEFYNALISEVGIPELNAASKDAAKMTIKISPEYTRLQSTDGPIKSPAYGTSQKWLLSNFRLEIDGLDSAGVSKIDAITIRQAVVENLVGAVRDYEKEPAHLEIPNIAISLAESKAQAFYDWHENFVIKGNNGQDQEKNGKIEMLGTNMEPLFVLTLKHLGIFRAAPDRNESGSEAIRRMRAEMYCEEMSIDFSGVVSDQSSQPAAIIGPNYLPPETAELASLQPRSGATLAPVSRQPAAVIGPNDLPPEIRNLPRPAPTLRFRS